MDKKVASLLCLTALLVAGSLPAAAQTPTKPVTVRLDTGSLSVPAYVNYGAWAASGVDDRLVSKTASTATQNFFSTYNTTTQVFTRNPACLYPWPSYVSCWNSANADGTGGNRGCVTMVTATQGVTNNHFSQIYAAGVQHVFLGTDGAQYILTVASAQRVGSTDIELVTFTAAAPASVGVARVLPTGAPTQMFAAGTPLLATNQQKQAVIIELNSVPANGAANELSFRAATATNRAAWTTAGPGVTGDSDSPIFALVNDVPVLLSTYHSTNSGPSYAENVAAINALLTNGTSLSVVAVNLLPSTTAGVQIAGDLGGTAAQPKVVGLQGQSVSATSPATGNVLAWSGTTWQPQAPASASVNGQPISPSSLTVSGEADFNGLAVFSQPLRWPGYKVLALGGQGTPNGSGSPEGQYAAAAGSLYTDNATGGTGVWYKSTAGGNTGWVPILTSANGVTSINGQTGPVSGAQAVAGADIVPNKVTAVAVMSPGGGTTLSMGEYGIGAYGSNGVNGWASFTVGNFTAVGTSTLLPQSSTPAAPASGVTLYVDSVGDLHALHSNGTNHTVSAH